MGKHGRTFPGFLLKGKRWGWREGLSDSCICRSAKRPGSGIKRRRRGERCADLVPQPTEYLKLLNYFCMLSVQRGETGHVEGQALLTRRCDHCLEPANATF